MAGARAPLLDRLVDADPTSPHEVRPLRVLDREALKESVRRELERLLNTRCAIPVYLYQERRGSVIDYGVPDFSALSPQNADDQSRLARILSQSIETFEPRLRQVQVSVQRLEGTPRALWVKIDAILAVESIAEPVSFPVLIQPKNGEAKVHADP